MIMRLHAHILPQPPPISHLLLILKQSHSSTISQRHRNPHRPISTRPTYPPPFLVEDTRWQARLADGADLAIENLLYTNKQIEA